jgi:hypothetical protein
VDDFACGQIADRIAGLEQQVEFLEDLLADPELTPAQRGSIRQQIRGARSTIAGLKEQLAECRSDITIVGIEKTQGTQFFSINGQGSGNAPDNSVPLIAQRTLVLRVYVDCKRAKQQGPQQIPIQIAGRVVVDRIQTNGSVQHIRVLNPINGPIAARSADSIDRGDPTHSLNFRVAASDCQGVLRFTVSVYEQGPIVTDEVSRRATATLSTGSDTFSLQVYGRFEPVPTFRVHAVLVHYTGDGVDLPAPSALDFANTLEYVVRTYPIGRLEFEDCMEIDFDKSLSTMGGGCGPGFEGPGGLMEILEDLDDSSDRPAIRVALIPSEAQTSTSGCGNTNIAATKNGREETLAQEMGHALDRKHAPAGGAGGPDPNYPTYNDYPSGSIGEYGFDVVTSEVYDPNETIDFMGYASDRWVSPYTYMGIRGAMVERFGAVSFSRRAAGRLARQPEDVRQETLFLSFRVKRDGNVVVRPSFHLPALVRPPGERPLSEVSCELLDEGGDVLVFHRCRLRGSHLDPDGPHIDFHEAIPWVAQAAAIRFLRNNEVVHVHDIEANAPTVEIPEASFRYSDKPMTFTWSGRHPSAALRYMVRYSADDGKTWRVFAASLGRQEWRLQPRQLPGGDRCLLQVVASSGIRTSVAQTQPFSSPRKPRSAVILSPKSNSETGAARSAVLRGGAFSSDFGLGAMEDVVWTSNLDGVLGRGFEVVADDLSSGVHTITLSVPDGQGGMATASTLLRVTPLAQD